MGNRKTDTFTPSSQIQIKLRLIAAESHHHLKATLLPLSEINQEGINSTLNVQMLMREIAIVFAMTPLLSVKDRTGYGNSWFLRVLVETG